MNLPTVDPTLKPGQWAFSAADMPEQFRQKRPNMPRVLVVAGNLDVAKQNLVASMRAMGFTVDPIPEPVAYGPTTKRKAAQK